MTAEERKIIKDWITSLSDDELEGALDALQDIQAARMGGGGPTMPPAPITEIDPELDEPESEKGNSDDDLEIDDPEDLLKELDSDEGDEMDDEDAEESESKDSESGEEDGHPGDDASGETDSERKGDDDGEQVDDETDLPDSVYKDPTEEEQKKKEVFRRKVELSSAKKQIQRAKKKIEKGEVDATSEQKQALDDLEKEISDKLQELNDNPDSVKDTSAKDFNDFISKALDVADDLGVKHTKIFDVENRIKKIKDSTEDSLSAQELEDEDTANRMKDPEYQKMKAREREKERIARERERMEKDTGGFKGDLEAFKLDLKKAIGDQIEDMLEVEEETYARVNRWHEDDDMALPGVRIDEIPDYNKPSIDVYFDQSGSWGDREVKRGLAAIADILDLEKEGLLNLEIYYFSEILSQDQEAARRRGARECWDLIIENVNAYPKTKNVIIMTDTDISYDYRSPGQRGCINGPGTEVDGCVWFLWKNGSRVAAAHHKLRGKKGTFEYSV